MTTYPVHVQARLDAPLSRWLWLLKWLLAIPHFVVLFFLWAAFAVSSIVAFFGILFTGRYPRALFEFNVGVLRWSWRVGYYAYGALGTDQYPPFTLREVPEYPAHLEVDYPEHLSRGLVLVKWWLLAIPHYLVLALLLGGAAYGARETRTGVWDTGLIGVLVLVAGVALLFTGRYPARLFDLVLGLNRWVLRVAAYVALMTDTYPPFALDQGGSDPDGGVLVAASTPPASPQAPLTGPAQSAPATPVAPPPPVPPGPGSGSGSASRWTTGRVVSLVAGCLAALVALGLALGGAALLVADRAGRDASGYLTSPTVFAGTTGYAITTERVSMGGGMMQRDSAGSSVPRAMMGDIRISAQARGGKAVFVGIARTADVDRYLSGVDHCVLRGFVDGSATCDQVFGVRHATPPASEDFWIQRSSGRTAQTLTWTPEAGDWTAVVMNADGTPAVAADMSIGAQVPALSWIAGGMLVLALVLGLAAIFLIALPLRRASRRAQPAP